MKYELINVTPKLAAQWLRKNTSNRALRRTVVDGLRHAFERGEYVPTHQGIAFSESGELLDGQHRLTAISELKSGIFPMLVARDVDQAAHLVMDTGLKRDTADCLGEPDRRIVEVARLVALICLCPGGVSDLTAAIVKPAVELVRLPHAELMAACPTSARSWSTVAMRTAAVYHILRGTEEGVYAKRAYAALVYGRFDEMPLPAQALYRSVSTHGTHSRSPFDMLARGMKAFDRKNAWASKVQINDYKVQTQELREALTPLLAP